MSGRVHMPVDRETWRSLPCKLCGDVAEVESVFCERCAQDLVDERAAVLERREAARHAASHEERSGRG